MRKFRLPTKMADGGMTGAPQFAPAWGQPNQPPNQGGMVNPADFAYARAATPSTPQGMAPQQAPMPGQSPSDLMQAQRQFDPRMTQGFMPQKRRSWQDYAGDVLSGGGIGALIGGAGGSALGGGVAAGIVTAIKEILKAKSAKKSTVVKSKKGGPVKKAKGGPIRKKKGC